MTTSLELPQLPIHSSRMIALTQPVDEAAGLIQNSEQLLAFFARVSSTKNRFKHESGPKLIRSLINREEWSPLEMVTASYEIRTTRDIARQMLRHATLRPQEFSQRYAVVIEDFELRECRLQHPTDRQMSIECEDEVLNGWWRNAQEEVFTIIRSKYNEALAKNIAKECARAILPEGNTPSLCYFTGPIRSWYHYTKLRTKGSTQKEHRQIADSCWSHLIRHIPSLGSL